MHSYSCIPLGGGLGLGSAGTSGTAGHFSLRSHSFSRYQVALLHVVLAEFQEGTPQCVSTYEAPAWVIHADVLVVKASYMANPSLSREGDYYMGPGRCDSLGFLRETTCHSYN